VQWIDQVSDRVPTSEDMKSSREHLRLAEDAQGIRFWKRWGPYVSERSWGTVREDYSPHGDAWGFLTHDMARSKAYRWGEDGIAGFCDRYQILAFSLALWNEKDPILKERAFGLVPSEGNHGEDVKEYYFYLDSTPTHSYMKYLYKYVQSEYPYSQLIEENKRRAGKGPEYELLDTGIFDHDQYFDVFVEYAKEDDESTIIKITAHNRGPTRAPLHLIPQLTFRNAWSWGPERKAEPKLRLRSQGADGITLEADDSGTDLIENITYNYKLGPLFLHGPAGARPLFTNNESNCERLYGTPSRSPFVKDAFHRAIINGESCVNPEHIGTKAGLHYRLEIEPGESQSITLYLGRDSSGAPLQRSENVLYERLQEANEFYETVHPSRASADERLIQRQALAGLLWNKQMYLFDVEKWFEGDDPSFPPPQQRTKIRNVHWKHLNSMRILSMPDTWEYPWFAAWDLAFHCVSLALVDPDFAKEQLWFMLFEQFQHPNGQIPAYEWEFSDLNPPVQAWAVWRVFHLERVKHGKADRDFLEKCFHKLLLNFTWWVNKVDSEGNNIFEGGFLGLDNIALIDRSETLPEGFKLEQADATGWMGFFALVMMRTALELAKDSPVHESLATKFFQHYVYVGAALKNMGGRNVSLWDEGDGFFHDLLRFPDGSYHPLSVRSLVGIIPLYAAERLEMRWLENFSDFRKRLEWFLKNRQDLVQSCCYPMQHGDDTSWVLTIFDQTQLLRLLERVFSSDEFLSEYGVRSLSRFHYDHPFRLAGREVRYEPAESECKLKGGNSNWRGPIWFPTSFLIIESLKKLSKAYPPGYTIPQPDGSTVTFTDLAQNIADRLIAIFTRNERGERPVFGNCKKFQNDPHWRDYILFYEYFNGDDGSGLGASHQTGWTALVATLIDEWRG
jgi:hypothetical protein